VVFSAPSLVALLLHQVPPGPDWLSDAYLNNETIRQTAGKVVISEWEEASRLYPLVNRELMSRVRIIETGGKVHENIVRIPKGDPRNPMSEEELFKKLDMLTTPVLGKEKTERLHQVIMYNLEKRDSIGEIVALLMP
jgi:2-methylcitrate dehydratase